MIVMAKPRPALDLLRQTGKQPDETIDLAGAALALATLDFPGLDPEPYRGHLDRIAEETSRTLDEETIEDKVRALRTVLAGRYRYHGDDDAYDDLQNANLIKVIERRKGLPVALGLIYMHTVERLGWTMEGLNFPGHFLVRLVHGSRRLILDPFHGGKIRQTEDLRDLIKSSEGAAAELRPEFFQPVSKRDILLRLQNSIKMRHLRHDRLDAAIAVLQSMALIAPTRATLWREIGTLQARTGNLRASISALETCLSLGIDTIDQTRDLLQKLRQQLS